MTEDPRNEPIAIVGAACRLPGGVHDLDSYWALLRDGRDALVPVPPERWDRAAFFDADPDAPGKCYVDQAGFVADVDRFDAAFFAIQPDEAAAMDPQHRLLLETAWHALESAALVPDARFGERTGLFVGLCTDDYAQLGLPMHALSAVSAHQQLGGMRALAAGRVAYHLNLQGPVMQLDTTCSSSLLAVHQACRSLRSGETDCALAGGVNLILSPAPMVAMSRLRALSPSQRSRAFSADADGYARGEGVGLVVLKRLSDAQRAGDPVIAVIRGSAINHDGASNGLTAPNGLAQERVIVAALRDAGVAPSAVGYVEAHGTGTLMGDPIEVGALARAYAPGRDGAHSPLWIGSTKSNIGHLEAAAGIAGLLKLCAALRHRQLPASLHVQRLNPHVPWDRVPVRVATGLQDWSAPSGGARCAAVSAFGLSGTNVHVVVEEAPIPGATVPASSTCLLPLSARTPEALRALARRYRDLLTDDAGIDLRTLCFSTATGRKAFAQRLVIAADSTAQAVERLDAWLADAAALGDDSGMPPALRDAAQAWLRRKPVDWTSLFEGHDGRRCAVPRYPFARERHWLAQQWSFTGETLPATTPSLLHALRWQPWAAQRGRLTSCLILGADSLSARTLADTLRDRGTDVTQAMAPTLRPDTTAEACIWLAPDNHSIEATLDELATVAQWVNARPAAPRLWIVTRQAFTDNEASDLTGAAIWGWARSARLELGARWGGLVDLPAGDAARSHERLAECLAAQTTEDEFIVRVDGTAIEVPRLEAATRPVDDAAFTCDPSGSYLLTGGLGALGMALAEELVQAGARHLVLASREGPERLARDADCAARVSAWQARGVAVDVRRLDASQATEVADCLAQLARDGRRLKGIVHAAGALDRGPLAGLLQPAAPRTGWHAKVDGARHLDRLSRGAALDFFWLCSSVTALWGMPALATYGAANACLDAIAVGRRAEGLPALSLRLGRFEVAGMMSDADAAGLDVIGIAPMRLRDAMAAIRSAAQQDAPVATLVAADWPRFARHRREHGPAMLFTQLAGDAAPVATDIAPPTTDRHAWLARTIAEAMKLPVAQVADTGNLFELGLNSLMSIVIRRKIEAAWGLSTAATLMFEHPSVDALATWLARHSQQPQAAARDAGPPRTVFLFSGQGNVHAGMGRDFYAQAPGFRHTVDECCAQLQAEFGYDLRERLFSTDPEALSRTGDAQPALFVVELAMARLWEAQGVRADCLLGHSMGEFAAACLAGVFSQADALRLVMARARLVQALPEDGGMYAVFAPRQAVDAALARWPGLSLAAVNSSRQFVLSADNATLADCIPALQQEGISCQPLMMRHAFHSPRLRPMHAAFAEVARSLRFSPPKRPLISTVTGMPAGDDIATPAYWVHHIEATVRFDEAMRLALREGGNRFIEIGPRDALTGIAQELAGEVDAASGEGPMQREFIASLPRDEHGAFEAWESAVQRLRPTALLAPDPARRHDPFPMTPMQQAYWLGRHAAVAGGQVAIHMYLELDVPALDVARMEQAWNALIARHDMLRAIALPDGSQQVLAEVPRIALACHDARDADDAQLAAHLSEVRGVLSHRNVALDRWPLFDIRATHLPGDVSRLHISLDGWCLDGWSYQILFHELHRLYVDPQANLRPLSLGFRDYVLGLQELEKGEAHAAALQRWQQRLPTLPPAPRLPLCEVHGIAPLQGGFNRWQRQLDSTVFAGLQRHAARHSLTAATAMLAAYARVLSRWSESTDIALNVPRFNRQPLHPDVPHLVGEFASFTLLAVRRRAGEDFATQARGLQAQLWEDMEGTPVAGVTLLRELNRLHRLQAREHGEATGPVLMPYVFTNMPEEALDGSQIGLLDAWGADGRIHDFITQTPQVWLDCQYHLRDGGLFVFWDALDNVFAPGLLDALFEAYVGLLTKLAHDDAAWTEVDPLPLPTAQAQVRDRINGVVRALPQDTLYDRFARSVEQHGARPAVLGEGWTLSYRELDTQASRLAGRILRTLGERAPDAGPPVVAVVMRKGWQQVAGVLAVLAAGGVVLPLDPEMPASRLAWMLGDADAALVVVREGGPVLPEGHALQQLVVEEHATPHATGISLPLRAHDGLAFIIYTSGSSGEPKGARIGEPGLLNSVDFTIERFGIGSADRLLALTPLHHDMACFDLFGALSVGAGIVMPEPVGTKDPGHWLRLMQAHGVSVWNSVPAMLDMLLSHAESDAAMAREACGALRLAFLGGDWIALTLPARLQRLNAAARVVSVGGPTETTLWNVMHEVEALDPHWRSIPYGRPIANTRYHVLDDLLEERPDGVIGEMHVCGIGVAQGYVGDPARSAAVFLRHPRTGERMYRTGDLGRYGADGTLEFMGRRDRQVKISGVRIEPAEIEAALLRHPGVTAVAAVIVGDGTHRRLAAVWVPKAGTPADAEALRLHAAAELPLALRPTAWLPLPALPLTANGKVDRRAIAAFVLAAVAPQAPRTPASPERMNAVQQQIARLWADLLERPSVGLRENFFDAGGNSLLATQLFVQLRAAWPRIASVVTLYEHPTVEALAAHLQPGEHAAPRSGALPAAASRGERRRALHQGTAPSNQLPQLP
ncbi:non-ribosomal peptide synthetase/type I polyketide synthase [Variovorax boronicumulans]|uniref:non-ribosomal peptide synthetase/type I polyketide synthase n=1 Tax=Variovorax boronicumulans TaxID=436515 RepID=UPI003392B574